ncbi:MAG: hypothetical protein R2856_35395 [Caldilineaceae bacterium]
MEKIYLTWQDVEELVSNVVMKLHPPYDALLLIRGGIIPGGMIARRA